MSKKEQRKAPVLRFKGFTDDWEQRKLGDKITRIKSYSISHGYETMHDTNTKYIHYGDIHTGKVKIINDINILPNIKDNNYIGLNKGDIVVADASEDYKGIADACLVNTDTDSNKIVAGLHTIALRPQKDTYPQYLYTYLSTDIFKHFGYKTGTGLKVFGISYKELAKFLVSSPSIKEQKEISKLISLIEKNIDLQQRKLKELKQIKGSLLTKILAGKNSNQPILRFRNFKNNWKQYRLKDLYTYSNGKAHEQRQQLNGKYELINLNSISIDGSLKSSGKYVNKSKDILKKNDLVMVLSDIAHGLLLGRVAVIPKDNKYVLNQRIALLRPQKNDENSNFMASLINNNQSYFHRMGSGTSQLNISKSAVTESKWFIPEPDEQLAIGNLLKEIDNYIFLQQDKINQLTALRKFLSQNLFI